MLTKGLKMPSVCPKMVEILQFVSSGAECYVQEFHTQSAVSLSQLFQPTVTALGLSSL